MDVDVADQRDFHRRGIAFEFLVDRGDIRRRRQLGVRQIEGEPGVERQRELLVVQHRRDADAVGHFKYEADEGRLHRRADADRRPLLGLGDRPLLTQRALGVARAFGQFADHLGGKCRRRPLPGVRQQIDEYPFARRHGVDGHPARQRQPDRRAVGIAPRRADIIGHRVGQLVDRDIHRVLEPDHDDRAGHGHLGIDILGELENQPGVAARLREGRLALDRIRGMAGAGEYRAKQNQAGGKPRRPAEAAPGRARAGAETRPKSSGSRSRHIEGSFSSPADRQRDAPAPAHLNLELAI